MCARQLNYFVFFVPLAPPQLPGINCSLMALCTRTFYLKEHNVNKIAKDYCIQRKGTYNVMFYLNYSNYGVDFEALRCQGK